MSIASLIFLNFDMCYDVRYLTKKKENYTRKLGITDDNSEKLAQQLSAFVAQIGPVYHTTAFEHWRMPVITMSQPDTFQFFHWGLIPAFVKNLTQYQEKYSSRYLNSRVEGLFEPKMFHPKLNRSVENPFFSSVQSGRCIVLLDGYYDWHWQGKKSYNFHIGLSNDEPMLVAGISRTWQNDSGELRDTVSLVTTPANTLCASVHNRPKGSEGERQLAILDRDAAMNWIAPDASLDQLKKVITVFPESEMKAYPVKKLFDQDGRRRVSLNDPACIEEKQFPELTWGESGAIQALLF